MFDTKVTSDWSLGYRGEVWVLGRKFESYEVDKALTALTDAIAERDRQVEANKPKPGEFGPGDRIAANFNNSNITGRVVNVNGKRGVIFDDDLTTVLVEDDGWVPGLYVKID